MEWEEGGKGRWVELGSRRGTDDLVKWGETGGRSVYATINWQERREEAQPFPLVQFLAKSGQAESSWGGPQQPVKWRRAGVPTNYSRLATPLRSANGLSFLVLVESAAERLDSGAARATRALL